MGRARINYDDRVNWGKIYFLVSDINIILSLPIEDCKERYNVNHVIEALKITVNELEREVKKTFNKNP